MGAGEAITIKAYIVARHYKMEWWDITPARSPSRSRKEVEK